MATTTIDILKGHSSTDGAVKTEPSSTSTKVAFAALAVLGAVAFGVGISGIMTPNGRIANLFGRVGSITSAAAGGAVTTLTSVWLCTKHFQTKKALENITFENSPEYTHVDSDHPVNGQYSVKNNRFYFTTINGLESSLPINNLQSPFELALSASRGKLSLPDGTVVVEANEKGEMRPSTGGMAALEKTLLKRAALISAYTVEDGDQLTLKHSGIQFALETDGASGVRKVGTKTVLDREGRIDLEVLEALARSTWTKIELPADCIASDEVCAKLEELHKEGQKSYAFVEADGHKEIYMVKENGIFCQEAPEELNFILLMQASNKVADREVRLEPQPEEEAAAPKGPTFIDNPFLSENLENTPNSYGYTLNPVDNKLECGLAGIHLEGIIAKWPILSLPLPGHLYHESGQVFLIDTEGNRQLFMSQEKLDNAKLVESAHASLTKSPFEQFSEFDGNTIEEAFDKAQRKRRGDVDNQLVLLTAGESMKLAVLFYEELYISKNEGGARKPVKGNDALTWLEIEGKKLAVLDGKNQKGFVLEGIEGGFTEANLTEFDKVGPSTQDQEQYASLDMFEKYGIPGTATRFMEPNKDFFALKGTDKNVTCIDAEKDELRGSIHLGGGVYLPKDGSPAIQFDQDSAESINAILKKHYEAKE